MGGPWSQPVGQAHPASVLHVGGYERTGVPQGPAASTHPHPFAGSRPSVASAGGCVQSHLWGVKQWFGGLDIGGSALTVLLLACGEESLCASHAPGAG